MLYISLSLPSSSSLLRARVLRVLRSCYPLKVSCCLAAPRASQNPRANGGIGISVFNQQVAFRICAFARSERVPTGPPSPPARPPARPPPALSTNRGSSSFRLPSPARIKLEIFRLTGRSIIGGPASDRILHPRENIRSPPRTVNDNWSARYAKLSGAPYGAL